MRAGTRITVAAAALLLAGRAGAQSVTYDYDRAADFSRFRTYTWVRGANVRDELNHKRIMAAIDAQLASKGLVKADSGSSPDLLVAYHANFSNEVEVTGYSSGWGGTRWGPGQWGSARAQQITVGTLIVDLVDGKTRSLVWRGTATREIDTRASPEKRDRSINRAAEKLFKHYPPGK